MLLHNLFENTHIGEADTASVNWHTDSEQQQMDANRRGALQREREPAGSDAIDAQLRARNAQLAQYTQSGKFWLKQKDTQQHIGTTSYTGKAAANAAALELLKQQPELKGNLVITAYGPDETQGVAEGSEQVYNIVAVDKGNAMAKPKKLTYKAGSIEEVFDALAANDWYPLEINGVEVINGNHLKQGVAEGLPQTLRKVVPGYAKREIDKKMDAEKFGRTDVDRDANFQRYKKIQDKIKEQGVAEGEKVGNMDADAFDAAMSRLKKLAGAGPMKTVWDPTKRVYKNVPTAVQPKK